MSYTPSTDFVGLWRNGGTGYSKLDMPGLDFVVAALGRAGLITVTVSATQPLANQNITAWFQPAAPSSSGEGALFLWDPVATAYAPASMVLLRKMLTASAASNDTAWWLVAGGPPANTVGNNGDLALRTDFPGGIYGPKAAGAWPATQIAGSTHTVDSTALDATFGIAPGSLIYRGGTVWQSLGIGAANTLLFSGGTAPGWETLSALLDAVFSTAQGSLLYRGAALWNALAPGIAGYNLVTNGPGLNPTWNTPGAEFASGTVMLFRQTAAPTNWTKQTSVNDAGLRVTSGAVGSGGSVGFNTLFATTAVGNTTLTQATMPSHVHSTVIPAFYNTFGGGSFGAAGSPSASANTGSAGSDGAHTHALNLQLSYVDVIIATKN